MTIERQDKAQPRKSRSNLQAAPEAPAFVPPPPSSWRPTKKGGAPYLEGSIYNTQQAPGTGSNTSSSTAPAPPSQKGACRQCVSAQTKCTFEWAPCKRCIEMNLLPCRYKCWPCRKARTACTDEWPACERCATVEEMECYYSQVCLECEAAEADCYNRTPDCAMCQEKGQQCDWPEN